LIQGGDAYMTQLIDDDKIYEFIKKRINTSIGDICIAFEISESTVRRAFVRLEQAGHIRRYRGGAVAIPAKTTIYDRRLQDFFIEKDTIAQKAAESIDDGSSVILLGGTTVNAICPYLHGKNLSVITNSLTVIDQLKGSPGLQLIMLGGMYDHEEYEFVGDITTMGVQIMYADSLFIGCVGFSPEVGFMTNHIDSIGFYKLCMKSANKSYVLADSSKASRSGIAIFASINEISHIITDNGILPEIATSLSELGVGVIIA